MPSLSLTGAGPSFLVSLGGKSVFITVDSVETVSSTCCVDKEGSPLLWGSSKGEPSCRGIEVAPPSAQAQPETFLGTNSTELTSSGLEPGPCIPIQHKGTQYE